MMDVTRRSERTVTFTKPFVVKAWGEPLPAGAYTVETEEGLFEGVSVRGWRRTATLLHLRPTTAAPGVWHTVEIDPRDLEVALLHDADAVVATAAVLPFVGAQRLPEVPVDEREK